MTKPHPKSERSLVIVKPDGVQRSLIGEIIKRFERVGYKLVAVKMVVPKADFIQKHYTFDSEWHMKTGTKTINAYTARGLKHPDGEDPVKVSDVILKKLINYMTSGPVVAMVWQGAHAVDMIRKLVGGTEPRTSDVGTIRGDYVHDSYEMSDPDKRSIRNLVHASGSPKEAEDEISHWFKKDEIIDYKLAQESILYDVNLDGILE